MCMCVRVNRALLFFLDFYFHQAINYRFSMSIDKFIRLRKCVGHFIVSSFLVPSVAAIDGWLLDWMIIFFSFFFSPNLHTYLLRIGLKLHRPHVDTITNRPAPRTTHATTNVLCSRRSYTHYTYTHKL